MDERLMVIRADLTRMDTYVPDSKPWRLARNRLIRYSRVVDPTELLGIVPADLIAEAHPTWSIDRAEN